MILSERAWFRIRNLPNRLRGWREEWAHLMGRGGSELSIVVTRADGATIDYGVVSRRVITTVGVQFLATAMANTTEPELMNYHACGTNGAAEVIGDTALGAEVETRVAGVQSNPANGVYRTVGIITITADRALLEHGIFSQLALGGTLLDRSIYAVINVVATNTVTYTYNLTFGSGG